MPNNIEKKFESKIGRGFDLNEFREKGKTEEGYRFTGKDGKEFRLKIEENFAEDILKNVTISIYDPDKFMKEVGKTKIKIKSRTTAVCFFMGVSGSYTKYFGGDYKGIGTGLLLGIAGQYLRSRGIEKLLIWKDVTDADGFYQKIGARGPRHPEIPKDVRYSLKRELWKMRFDPYYEISWEEHLKSVKEKVTEWTEEHPGELLDRAEFIEKYEKLNEKWYKRILKKIEEVKKEKGEEYVERMRVKLSEWKDLYQTFDLRKNRIPEIDIKKNLAAEEDDGKSQRGRKKNNLLCMYQQEILGKPESENNG